MKQVLQLCLLCLFSLGLDGARHTQDQSHSLMEATAPEHQQKVQPWLPYSPPHEFSIAHMVSRTRRQSGSKNGKKKKPNIGAYSTLSVRDAQRTPSTSKVKRWIEGDLHWPWGPFHPEEGTSVRRSGPPPQVSRVKRQAETVPKRTKKPRHPGGGSLIGRPGLPPQAARKKRQPPVLQSRVDRP